MNNTFFQHNRTGNNRVTVCGVFVREQKKFVISGVAIPEKSFKRSIGRHAAIIRTSVRPMFTQACENWKGAKEIFEKYSPLLLTMLAACPEAYLLFQKFDGEPVAELVHETVEETTEIGTVVRELPKPQKQIA